MKKRKKNRVQFQGNSRDLRRVSSLLRVFGIILSFLWDSVTPVLLYNIIPQRTAHKSWRLYLVQITHSTQVKPLQAQTQMLFF